MFFHEPAFGFIDEATLVVSVEVIEALYTTCGTFRRYFGSSLTNS